MPKLIDPPEGCRFAPRCKFAVPECSAATPALRQPVAGHKVRCIFDIEDGVVVRGPVREAVAA